MASPGLKYFGLAGRLRRWPFWLFLVTSLGLIIPISLAAPPIGALLGLVLLPPLVSATTRRLHDVGLTGWWLIPLVAIPAAMLIVLAVGNSMFTLIFLAVLKVNVGESDLTVFFVGAETVLAYALGAWMLLSMVAFAWNGMPEPNSYGKNPRDDEPADLNLVSQPEIERASRWRSSPEAVIKNNAGQP